MTSALSEWESFYVIVGSSAGALTGLQFVVMALVADLSRRALPDTIGAFASPNIVHFCVVLFMSAVLSAPWENIANADWVLGAVAVAGLIYATIVLRRARRQTGYDPVLEDWIFHVILPYVSYGLLLIGCVVLNRDQTLALFMFGAVSLLLMFVGIHNAWDTATFLVAQRVNERSEPRPSQPADSRQHQEPLQPPPADNSVPPSSPTA
jgi:hypothetical protein